MPVLIIHASISDVGHGDHVSKVVETVVRRVAAAKREV